MLSDHQAGGADWPKVVKRETKLKSGEIIESVMIKDKPDDYDWHQKLDKPQSIVTHLWYLPKDDGKKKANAQTKTTKNENAQGHHVGSAQEGRGRRGESPNCSTS